MMTDMEKDIEERIKEWYQSVDDEYFDGFQRTGNFKPWHHLHDEERQMLAEMFTEDQLT